MDHTAPRIPTLVVSGFLGSGKTTLVRRLLDQAQGRGERLAIVSNEFGALGIDQALLESGEGRYVELAGGCVCCTLSDELVQVLEAVRREVTPDRIVIETSGVALPYETQLSLWRPPVSAWVGDDMAVVLVNAEQLAEGRDLGATFEQQVSSADLLLRRCSSRPSWTPAPTGAAPPARTYTSRSRWRPGRPRPGWHRKS
jgi:cobalamin biosynthesis protein CobW